MMKVLLGLGILCAISFLLELIESPRRWKARYTSPVNNEDVRIVRSFAGCGLILIHTIVKFRYDDRSDDWRNENSSEVRYVFLCILYVPIIPIRCYRVKTKSDVVLSH